MYNFNLPFIPERTLKSRKSGITMVMDKGLSLKETENFISASSDYTDFVKFGFGTSLLCKNLKKKVKIYKEAKIKPYFGGTLFEAFYIRNMLSQYVQYMDKFKINVIEVSDGSMNIPHEKKCELIEKLSKDFIVISEVGSKDTGVFIPQTSWIKMIKNELSAGAFKVIAEARENGTAGIYDLTGMADSELITNIIKIINADNIIWETPIKTQAVWFIKLLGTNVNLGNIAPNEVIPTETLRIGLRGDTFFQFLPEKINRKTIKKI